MDFFHQSLYSWIVLSMLIFAFLHWIQAPYGRYNRAGWGPQLPNYLGWVLMEFVSPLAFNFFFWTGPGAQNPYGIFLCLLWTGHYFYRSLIYPFRVNSQGKKMPWAIVAMAIFFNSINGSFNGYALSQVAPPQVASGFLLGLQIAGFILFFLGWCLNFSSDEILINLRKNGESGVYRIPVGGAFRWVSCPNYLGEMIEWLGFALMAQNLAATSFAIWTMANLAPRALAHHKWYKKTFDKYPRERKALIPFLV